MTLLPCPLCTQQQTFFCFEDSDSFQQRYHHCPRCDLVFVVPDCRLGMVAEKARYDLHQNDDSPDYQAFLSRLANPVLDALQDFPSPAVGLDFGSGKSQAMANLFRRQGHCCDCYDIYYHPKQRLLHQQYDFLIASEVIEHLYHPKMVFEQWLSLLRPGGILGIMTGLRPNDIAFSDWWYKNDPTHVALFSATTMDYLQNHYRLRCLFSHHNVVLFST